MNTTTPALLFPGGLHRRVLRGPEQGGPGPRGAVTWRTRGPGAAIPEILVSCRESGRVTGLDTSDARGEFVLPLACDDYGAEDLDGPANGRYEPRIDPAPAGTADLVIRLEPSPT